LDRYPVTSKNILYLLTQGGHVLLSEERFQDFQRRLVSERNRYPFLREVIGQSKTPPLYRTNPELERLIEDYRALQVSA